MDKQNKRALTLSSLFKTFEYLVENGNDDMKFMINGEVIYSDELVFRYTEKTIEIIGHEFDKKTLRRSQELENRITEAIEMFYRNDN